jgi:hypothetical protein
VGGLTRVVGFESVTDEAHAVAIDAEHRRKYARFGDDYVKPMVAPEARAATLRLVRSDAAIKISIAK